MISETATNIDLLIVVVEDKLRAALANFFSRSGYRVQESKDAEHAFTIMQHQNFDVMILDMALPGLSGFDLLERLRQREMECEVIMLSRTALVDETVEAMKLGVHEFLTKPVRFKELALLVRKSYEAGKLRKENRQLRAVLRRQLVSPQIIGNSSAMQEIYRLVDHIGPTVEPVLIQGERGTGKEILANAIHQASPLVDKPLVVVHCAALSETRLESELFGYEKGAITGAVTAQAGLFEVADGGTLFIDEIGAFSASLQAKLLRILEDGTMRRTGYTMRRRANVRLIAATTRDMAGEVEAGRFREDLYYRINVLTINLPPLRERKEDIELLVKHFSGEEWSIDQDTMEALEQYHWPGNVRQLQNAIQRSKLLADDYRLRRENLPPEILVDTQQGKGLASESDTNLDSLNKKHIAEVLRKNLGNKARTARALGIGRRSLYRLLDKFHIDNVH
ncbi:MAG: sigma-54 dependent transcriptional regulator [Pirellulales bacterium]|nr:sigma-54 dependent transcriptional regulator [Pirellulales bacterium]